MTDQPPSNSSSFVLHARSAWSGLWVVLPLVMLVWVTWLLNQRVDAGVVRFDRAWGHSLLVKSLPGPRRGGSEPRVAPPLPNDASAWKVVSLLRGESTEEDLLHDALPVSLWWYRVSYTVPQGVKGPLALYIPRVVGAAVQVVSYENSRWLVRWDGSEQYQDQWNHPIFVQLGEAGAPGSVIEIAVRLTRNSDESHRMTALHIGPLVSLEELRHRRELLQLVTPQVGSLAFAALGLLALLHWSTRRQQYVYLLFALTAIAWVLHNLHYYIATPTQPTAVVWFRWVTHASIAWVLLLTSLFAMRFRTDRWQPQEKWLGLAVVSSTLLTLPVLSLESWVDPDILDNLPTGVALLSLGWLSGQAWRGPERELRIITLALWIVAFTIGHDALLSSGLINPESVYLLPLSTMVIFLALLQAAQIRYTDALWQVEHANALLERRLSEREAELRANHERLRGVEREQALLLERQRLMRDMHDGLGSTLMSTLVLVERDQLGNRAVAGLLRECVDDLRLVIDSLEPIDHDLVTLLAALRHRLGRRLETAGLVLDWQVEDVPPLPWLNPPDALQILRVVQEALTNILKHAQAQHIGICVQARGESIHVVITDDGVGFDLAHVTWGRGLRHLSQRAARLGSTVEVHSEPGRGTQVSLVLPLQRST